MSYNPQNPNGQATSANSSPVVIASDQSNVGVNHAQTAGTTTSTNNGAADAGTQRVTIANDSTGQIIARGNAASGATDSGNPIKVAGKYNSTPPTFTDGQRGDLQLDASGNLKTAVTGTISIANNSAVNVAQVAGTTTDTNSGVKSAGTQRVVLATDQPQLTNALKVDGSATTQPVSGTVTANMGTTNGLALDTSVTGLQVTQGSATSGQKGGLALGAVTTAAPAYTTAQSSPLSLDTGGSLRANVTNSITVGTHAVTQSGTWTVQPGNTANTTPWLVNLAPSTSGGWSVSSQTNLTSTATVSGAASKFGGYMFINLNATPAYIQVFNLATSGAVTLGTTTPTFVVPLPANNTAANGAGANLELTNGIAMSTGIQIAATTTPTGATTVTTGLTGFVLYK
jgi:hypothetical protein